jgi:NADPH:quinone reductase-like Zn-dependent oxidoreductase
VREARRTSRTPGRPLGKAAFYNVWAGHLRNLGALRARLRSDLTIVLGLLADGVLTAHITARLPLASAREAMELAGSRTVYGKVILVP